MRVCCNAHMCTKGTRAKTGLCRAHGRKSGAVSYRVEMLVGGQWYTNMLRFATWDGAQIHGRDLFMRWTQPSEWRVVSCDDDPSWGSTEIACETAVAMWRWGNAVFHVARRMRAREREEKRVARHTTATGYSACLTYEARYSQPCPCGGR